MISLQAIFTVLHIIGAVIGAGGALASDVIFLKAIKDEKVSSMEFSTLKTLSTLVWIGLILLILSGLGLFALDPVRLANSDKFLAKMTIVGVILINGILFHLIHLPFMKNHLKKKLLIAAPKGEAAMLIVSGVISASSWFYALILGAIGRLNLPYALFIGLWFFVLGMGALVSLVKMKYILNTKERGIVKMLAAGFFIIAAPLIGYAFNEGFEFGIQLVSDSTS